MKHVIVEYGGRQLVKKGFVLLLPYERQRCSAISGRQKFDLILTSPITPIIVYVI